MRKPNFFIVGAPRCGTTAMYEYLQAHPDVFMPDQKEPHYFASDFQGRKFSIYRGDISKYYALFADATTEKRLGEASVHYLQSERAAREIYDFNPESLIIIMLRSPVEMLHSYYYRLFYSGCEDIPAFQEALEAEPDRRAGRRMPPSLYVMPEALYYSEVPRYAEQIQRYWDVFGPSKVHIIIYDDFRQDPARSYRETLEFLQVDPGFQIDFQRVNSNKRPRNIWLQRLLNNPLLMAVGGRMTPIALPVYRLIRRLNTETVERSSITPETRQRLQQQFMPEVAKLSDLLGRDLTYWCRD
jgi:hypothetical protein